MKRILSLILVFAMFCAIIFCMSSCSSNADVVGVWKVSTEEYYIAGDNGAYLYIYENNTADMYSFGHFSGWHHGNVKYSWKIKGEYILIDNGSGNPWTLTYDDQYLYNAQGKVSFEKVSNDPTVDLY